MKLIVPFDIQAGTYASVTSTDLTEPHTLWVSGPTYAVGDVRYYGTRVYERRTAGAGTTTPDLDTANWLDKAPTNQWAMFDYQNSTASSKNPSFNATVSVVDLWAATGPMPLLTKVSVAMFGLVGFSANLTTYQSDGTTVKTSNSTTVGRYSDETAGSWSVQDLALNPGFPTKIQAVVTGAYGAGYVTAKCSSLVVGESINLGLAQQNPSISLISYSKKETDEFGVTSFVKRASSKRLSVKTLINNADMDIVWRTIALLDGVPCVMIVSDIAELKPLNAFGFIKDFSIDVAYATQSLCSIDFESLT